MNREQVEKILTCLMSNANESVKYLALNARDALNTTATLPVQLHDDHDHEHDHDHDHDDDHEHDQELSSSSAYDLMIAKILVCVILFCASSLCGSVPFLLNRYFKWTDTNTNARSATVVQCLLYFGGGVLLCTTFLHLLPEVNETVEALQECGTLHKLSFSLANLLMCCGFFLMYLIEESLHAYLHRNKHLLHEDEGAGAAFERGHSVRNSILMKGKQGSITSRRSTAPSLPDIPPKGALTIKDLLAQDVESPAICDTFTHTHNNNHNQEHSHNHSHANGQHSHLPIGEAGDDALTSSLRGFFIVLALSLHELFEGMAIGLESTSSAVWFMFGAVSAHKLVLAFCVGVELIVARTRPLLCCVYVFTFAIVSPIGIIIGALISHNKESTMASVPSAILQGFACGTLLYVVFFEILSKNHAGLKVYLALVVGFLVMFGFQQLGSNDEHGHSHGSCGNIADDHHHSHHGKSAPHTANSYDFEQQLQILRQSANQYLQNSKNNH